jgi:hypothetical protein
MLFKLCGIPWESKYSVVFCSASPASDFFKPAMLFPLEYMRIQADMQVGDSCELGMPTPPTKGGPVEIPRAWRPDCDPPPETDATYWTVRMLPGPQADPDYFTPDDMKVLCSSGGHSRIDRRWLADLGLLAVSEL